MLIFDEKAGPDNKVPRAYWSGILRRCYSGFSLTTKKAGTCWPSHLRIHPAMAEQIHDLLQAERGPRTWQAPIQIGYFPTIEEAREAYLRHKRTVLQELPQHVIETEIGPLS